VEPSDAFISQLTEAEREFIAGLVELLSHYRQRILGEADPAGPGVAGVLPAQLN
jgi:hypothetical protein